jgi:hypothetical protein
VPLRLLLHVATLSQILPLMVGIAGDRLRSPFRRAIALWCLILFVGDAAYMMASISRGPNLWLGYVVPPLGSALALWALALVHPDAIGRTAIRLAIPLEIAVGVVLTLTIEDTTTFSLVVSPFHALVALLAGSWVFLRLGLSEADGLVRRDWFWIVGGVMIYSATLTAWQPVSWFFRASDRVDLLLAVVHARAGADIVAFLAIAGGMLCPVPPTSSGGSSSPASSPWASSWAPSARRW